MSYKYNLDTVQQILLLLKIDLPKVQLVYDRLKHFYQNCYIQILS